MPIAISKSKFAWLSRSSALSALSEAIYKAYREAPRLESLAKHNGFVSNLFTSSVSSVRGRRHGVRRGLGAGVGGGVRAVLLPGRRAALRAAALPAAAARLRAAPGPRRLLPATLLLPARLAAAARDTW